MEIQKVSVVGHVLMCFGITQICVQSVYQAFVPEINNELLNKGLAAISQDRYEQIKRFEGDLSQCMKCGFCTFWCPVYQEERIEPSVAWGKNMMIRGLLAGNFEKTTEVSESNLPLFNRVRIHSAWSHTKVNCRRPV